MDRGVGAAARLPESDRKDLAVRALAGSETVSGLAARHGGSRQFVHRQVHQARTALEDAFSSATMDGAVLFELAVTGAWLRQVIVGLALICRSSYRGVVEFLRDLLGVPVSLGRVHDVLQAATRQASAINHDQDLSGIRVGLHDEIFQGATPVLAGVDAASTYCYLLAAERHRDADTWGVHLLDAAGRGLRPDYTIADAGRGLRAGQQAAEARASCLARDVRTLVQWLRHDVLALAGPDLATRRELFDFIVTELTAREPEDPRRIRPVRVALQNQRDDLLAFAGVLDTELAAIARAHAVPEPLVREACMLHRLPTPSPTYWQSWSELRARMGGKFHVLFDAVRRAMTDTPRSCSLVENLNSRLRTYFTLRRHLGGSYLDLLRFFLNHRRFLRSRHT